MRALARQTCLLLALLACAAVAVGLRPAGAATADTCAPRLRAVLNVTPRGVPLVTLNVNGGAAHLLLDTGAERTTLTESAAQRLGLLADFDHTQTVHGIGGNITAGIVRPELVTAAGHKLPGLTFVVVQVHLPPVGMEVVDGLLGADMLGRYDLDLDIGHHLIFLYDPSACVEPLLPWTRAYAAMEAHLSRHLHMAFPITLDGHDLTAFIDTGAQVSLVDAEATSRLGVSEATLALDDAVMMQGVSTEVVTARAHRFAKLGLAGALLMSPTVAVTPLRLDDGDMLMGTDVLMHQRIWLSYASRRIYVARPE
jgi:predicted aspartyl protease